MARVTRSRKIDIAEDHTALSIQTPLLENPAHQSTALSELSIGRNNLSTQEDEMVDSQVKDLKAAYRNALGVGKKGAKKGKNKKKGKQGSQTETEVPQEGLEVAVEGFEKVAESPVPEATRQLLQSREGSLRSLLENKSIRNLTETSEEGSDSQGQSQSAPVTRTTRQNSSKAQAGQYNLSALFALQTHSSQTQKPRDDFLTSLFGGRSGPSRAQKRSDPGQSNSYSKVMADHLISLAVENAVAEALKGTKKNSEFVELNETLDNGGDIAPQVELKDNSLARNQSKSPVKTLNEVEKAYGSEDSAASANDEAEDSFVEQITCRSPAKPVSRVEDSIEALDKLEEALEALDQVALAERIVSPEKTRLKLPPGTPLGDIESGEKIPLPAKATLKQSTGKPAKSKPGYATLRVKPTAPKHVPELKKASSMTFKHATSSSTKDNEDKTKVQPTAKAPVKRPASLLPPKESVKSTKQPTRATFELPGEAVARKLKEQREARIAQRESSEDSFHTGRVISGPKIKSTKQPTVPTFRLPGEEISQRKREAHEARLKAQEEEERKRREFKAKPLRKSIVPNSLPRDTVASRARQSRVGLENIDNDNLPVSKRGSHVGAHRPSMLQLEKAFANSSAPRAPGQPPVRKPSPVVQGFSGLSMSGRALQRTVSTNEAQVQRQRAKEIYNRDAKLAEDIEREKREREAAAKRAREEAAERGRQASREWAEKQLAKKLAQGDKGMSAGYGPGGQMGLKG
jgi:hypothetical protein